MQSLLTIGEQYCSNPKAIINKSKHTDGFSLLNKQTLLCLKGSLCQRVQKAIKG